MRILIVHNTLNDSRSVNGVLRHYVQMARAWIANGHSADFLTAKAGWAQLQELAPQSQRISSDGLFDATRHVEKTWTYFPAYAYRLCTAHWVRMPGPYDVVIASGQFIVEVYAGRVVARRCGARLAVKIHHVLHAQPKRQGFYDRLFLRAERLSCRWIHRHADVVFCSPAGVAADYRALERALGLAPRPMVESGYGLDLAAFDALPAAHPAYDVVFLGRMHEQKGVFDLPAYWRAVRQKLPAARLLVIGEGPHRRRTEQLVKEAGLADAITFTGGIPESHKNELLRQARLGLSLSYEEGWGLSIAEFLASGLPVVAYQLPVYDHVFPEQLDQVPLGDWQAAAEHTVTWLRDPEACRRRGEAGRQFIRRYDYRVVARQELAALEAVVRPETRKEDRPIRG
jgi:glycosyltransferase involved in cell wall biosynthesis